MAQEPGQNGMPHSRFSEQGLESDGSSGRRIDGTGALRSPFQQPERETGFFPRQDVSGSGQAHETEPLRDWQRDTWYGPYPMHEYPFDEPEDSPELREARSEKLTNRSGDFWRTQTSGYQFGQSAEKSETAQSPEKPREKGKGSAKKRYRILGVLAGGLALWAVLHFLVFTVRIISVQGNRQIPAAEVIRLSELRQGMPIFSLDTEKIERGIEGNPLLKYRYLEKKLPSTVILRVQEREPCCWMTSNGILYTMDKQRTVLTESEKLEKVPDDLVRVDGLNIRSGTLVGQTLTLETMEQQEVFSTLFLEMKVLGCTDLVLEADLSNLNSLLMTTRDGFTVALGSSEKIHAKLRSMLLTREELLSRGYVGGVINVSLPATPIYSPPTT